MLYQSKVISLLLSCCTCGVFTNRFPIPLPTCFSYMTREARWILSITVLLLVSQIKVVFSLVPRHLQDQIHVLWPFKYDPCWLSNLVSHYSLAHTHPHFSHCTLSPMLVGLLAHLGSPIFPTWKTFWNQLCFYPSARASCHSRSVKAPAHSSPKLHSTYYIGWLFTFCILCLIWLLYLFVTEANVTRTYQSDGTQMRFTAFPCPNHSIHFVFASQKPL